MTWDKHAYLNALKSSKLKPTERAILRLLADEYANKHGVCWPSYKTIADGTGFARDTVWRAVARLEGSGWLEVQRRPIENKNWDSNLYTLLPQVDLGSENPQDKGDESDMPQSDLATESRHPSDGESPNPPNEPIHAVVLVEENTFPSSLSASLKGLERDEDQISATRCEAITLITADECEFQCERTTRHPSRRCWQHQNVTEPRVLYRWGFTVTDLLDEFGIEEDDLPLGTTQAIDSMMCKGYSRSRILHFVIKRMKDSAA